LGKIPEKAEWIFSVCCNLFEPQFPSLPHNPPQVGFLENKIKNKAPAKAGALNDTEINSFHI